MVPVGRVRGCPSPFFSLAVAGMNGASRIRSCGAAAPPSGLFGFFGAVAGLTRPPAAALLNLRRPGRLTAGRACAPGLRGTPGLRLAPPPLY